MVKENDIVQFFEKGVKILKDSSESFNIFEMLGQSSREMTHSAFIAGLLNPKGNHNAGPSFLDLFLQKFNLTHFDSNSAEVIVEKDCGKECEDPICGWIEEWILKKNCYLLSMPSLKNLNK